MSGLNQVDLKFCSLDPEKFGGWVGWLVFFFTWGDFCIRWQELCDERLGVLVHLFKIPLLVLFVVRIISA